MATRHTKEVAITHGGSTLLADFTLPPSPTGVVIFAHGSGSRRHSPRNRYVARRLEHAGMATLLLDLLTLGEEHVNKTSRHYRYDIPLLAERIVSATDWVSSQPDVRGLPIGYFGSNTGAAAAMVASTYRPRLIKAIVSRGGRPDLAGSSLTSLWTPTRLIVGSLDQTVLAVNREYGRKICGTHDLQIVPGAGHLFEEPGTLDVVANLASDWYTRYLGAHAAEALGDEWDLDESLDYEHVLEGAIVRGEDRGI